MVITTRTQIDSRLIRLTSLLQFHTGAQMNWTVYCLVFSHTLSCSRDPNSSMIFYCDSFYVFFFTKRVYYVPVVVLCKFSEIFLLNGLISNSNYEFNSQAFCYFFSLYIFRPFAMQLTELYSSSRLIFFRSFWTLSLFFSFSQTHKHATVHVF